MHLQRFFFNFLQISFNQLKAYFFDILSVKYKIQEI